MRAACLTLLAAWALAATPCAAQLLPALRVGGPDEVAKLNRKLAGRLHDYTHNHGADRRVDSPALGEKRDLYAYTPPGYDGRTPFPFLLFLHGLGQDEKVFLDIVGNFDDAIRKGESPPFVIVCPDGSVGDRPSLVHTGSFYINSKAGRFGDYVAADVWDFAHRTFALRPEREAHVIAGASMGGFGAYNVGFKSRERYGSIVGVIPPLNMRYGDAAGNYLRDYDPDDFALRTVGRRSELIGQFYGVVLIRSRRVLDPIVGRSREEANRLVSRENPYEMLASYDVRPGEFNLFVGYARKDEFNLDAQAESFLAEAARRGVAVEAVVKPDGRHNMATALSLMPEVNRWLLPRVGPYAPEGYAPAGPAPAAGPRVALSRPLLPLLRP